MHYIDYDTLIRSMTALLQNVREMESTQRDQSETLHGLRTEIGTMHLKHDKEKARQAQFRAFVEEAFPDFKDSFARYCELQDMRNNQPQGE